MYGYRTKHKILAYYMEQVKGVPPPKIKFTEYAKGVNGVNENIVATYLLDMKFEGYFTFYDVPEHDQLIEITNSGIAAFIGEHILKKNKEVFWKATMNIFITLANIAVAMTAIWALTKDNGEVQKLEERLNKLEKEQQKVTAITNPSTSPNLRSNQTSSIQTAKSRSFYLDTFYIGVDTIYINN